MTGDPRLRKRRKSTQLLNSQLKRKRTGWPYIVYLYYETTRIDLIALSHAEIVRRMALSIWVAEKERLIIQWERHDSRFTCPSSQKSWFGNLTLLTWGLPSPINPSPEADAVAVVGGPVCNACQIRMPVDEGKFIVVEVVAGPGLGVQIDTYYINKDDAATQANVHCSVCLSNVVNKFFSRVSAHIVRNIY
ncbi:hypothetical protein GHT06_020544 [Daphnia sinensis]|uniref:Uncharacterized protein n=1 Tax=Daphnia sinensis TaxID=1820382 RepID=A0AAD5KYW2_9CRUS|nr:hypothetical protein GHT06_020544 [Daphnia sinensis]